MQTLWSADADLQFRNPQPLIYILHNLHNTQDLVLHTDHDLVLPAELDVYIKWKMRTVSTCGSQL
jgi:hypothetical protein